VARLRARSDCARRPPQGAVRDYMEQVAPLHARAAAPLGCAAPRSGCAVSARSRVPARPRASRASHVCLRCGFMRQFEIIFNFNLQQGFNVLVFNYRGVHLSRWKPARAPLCTGAGPALAGAHAVAWEPSGRPLASGVGPCAVVEESNFTCEVWADPGRALSRPTKRKSSEKLLQATVGEPVRGTVGEGGEREGVRERKPNSLENRAPCGAGILVLPWRDLLSPEA
jgi:hypothetical protein